VFKASIQLRQFESKVKRRWNNGCFIHSTKRDYQGPIKRSQKEGPGDKGTERAEETGSKEDKG
jgi:hypothetical protein